MSSLSPAPTSLSLTSEEKKRILSMAKSGLSYVEAVQKVLDLRPTPTEPVVKTIPAGSAPVTATRAIYRQCDGKGASGAPIDRAVRGLSSFEEKILRATADQFLTAAGGDFKSYSREARIAMLELYEAIRKECWHMRLGVSEYKEKSAARRKSRRDKEKFSAGGVPVAFGSLRLRGIDKSYKKLNSLQTASEDNE